MKLNWFAPLAPAKTGIADYTTGILPVLSEKAEVILWTTQTNWDPSLERYARVQRYHPKQIDWLAFNHADLSFYHIGNNHRFHASIWQVGQQAPGIVILHDLRLHDFFESLYRGHWRDERGYLAQMQACYGAKGLEAAAEFVNSERPNYDLMAQRFPMTALALENSVGVLVHTQEAYEELMRTNRWPVVYAPLPYSGAIPHRKKELSKTEPYRLIVFGHIGRNRRLAAVLKALSLLADKDRFHLDVYGEIDDPKSLRDLIRDSDSKRSVTVHGYVPGAELDQALQASSLAINLRYPTMGEASASQLRIWGHALPALVTRVGWYASLPEKIVAHVDPENEVEDIKSHLESFLEDPDRFARMGQEGLRFLEREHHPDAYVKTIVSLATNAPQFNLRKSAHDLARRSGALIGSWASETGDAPERVAEKIRTLFC